MGIFVKPVWTEQGPGPLAMPLGTYNTAAGAIQALVVDPVDPNRVYVASVGGGIWLTINALAADPAWVPQTDHLPSLTMSAIAMSPLDPNRTTLYAGCGRTSHGVPLVGPRGGPIFGLLKTTDGNTWLEIARSEFEGKFVARILPTSVQTAQGDRVLVATLEGGLHISEDGGATWTLAKAVGAPATDVMAEQASAPRVYVAAAHKIFRSDDAADQDWHDVTPPDWAALPAWATIRLAVSPGTDASGNRWLYASATGAPTGTSVLVTIDRGATWNRVGMPPDGSVPTAPMVVSPLRPDALFLATNAGSPNHYLALVSPGQATQWTLVENQGANNTAPHTDARDCAFALDGSVLFETNDGGISRLTNPHGFPKRPRRHWSQAVGNIRVAEFHAVAYDSVNHVIFGATQDNAIPQQTVPGGASWSINEEPWGDGFEVGVDVSSTPGAAIHYSSQQNLFHFVRRTYTGPALVSSIQYPNLVIAGSGGLHYNQVEGGIREDGTLGTVRWNQSWTLNAADPARLVLGTDFLYESFDRADTFVALGGLMKNKNGNWMPANPVGRVTAYAYGHGTNADVLYVGAGGRLLLRTSGGGLPQPVATYPGGSPVGIALDADSWEHAYVLDSSGRIFRTTDAGATTGNWHELTGDLPQKSGDIRAIVVIPRTKVANAEVVLAAGYGGVFVVRNPGDGRYAMWRKHGVNFPNAVVTGLQYSAADDSLIAGTFGRSAWALPKASDTLTDEPRVAIVSDHRVSCLFGWVEGSKVTFSAVILNGGALTGPLSFSWVILGAAPTTPFVSGQVTAVIAPAGTEVVVMVTVTDATGYSIVASLVGMSVTASVAIAREAFCELISRLRMEEIFNPFVNPLGPDVGPGGDIVPSPWPPMGPLAGGLVDYRSLHQLVARLDEVVGHLAAHDRLTVRQATLFERSAPTVRAWKSREAKTGRIVAIFGRSDGAPESGVGPRVPRSPANGDVER